MSPVLAHECPDTPLLALPCKPRVRAGLYTPRGLLPEGPPSHVPVEAPCSALADDTAEEWLCPYTYGSTMLRAGDKQLRAAPWPYQPQGALELSVWPHRNSSPRESGVRGLGTGAALGPRPSAHHPTRSPGPGRRAPLPRPRRGQVWQLFARQGGLLSIATQEPNWSRSPSLLSSKRLTAVEVCARPGSAYVER